MIVRTTHTSEMIIRGALNRLGRLPKMPNGRGRMISSLLRLESLKIKFPRRASTGVPETALVSGKIVAHLAAQYD